MNGRNTSVQGFNPQDFGKRLQNARKALGITQDDLAERLNVERSHVARMEIGVRGCSVDLLAEIATQLKVSADYLLGVKDVDAKRQALLLAIEELEKVVQSL